MHIHFDGDLLVYRAGFAAEKQEWHAHTDDGFTTHTTKAEAAKHGAVEKGERRVEPVENALHNVGRLVDTALNNLGATVDDMTMYLSGRDNFREGVATIKPYKGNRDASHKPVHGPAIREYMKRHYDAVVSENEEADDQVGYSHYHMWLQDERSSVICTVDKDLDMIPGMHYNFVKDETYYMTAEAADKWFYLQLLMGDSTDNIPGLPGVGAKTAAKMLKGVQPDCFYDVARKEYLEAYEDGIAALIENARLLWIRRQPHEWWVPPQESDIPED